MLPRLVPQRYDLLLSAAHIEERRLVYAELLERGYSVLPVPGIRYALRAVHFGLVAPRLVLLDVYGDDDATLNHLDQMLSLVSDIPVIVVVGATDADRWESLRPRVVRLLRRPISVGQIVDVVGPVLPMEGRAR